MGIIETIKTASEVISGIESYSLKKEMLDLLTVCEELQKENKELREQLEIEESLKFDDGAYWKEDGDGPFCSSCWDSDKQLIRTQKHITMNKMVCPKCKSEYKTEEQRKQIKSNYMFFK